MLGTQVFSGAVPRLPARLLKPEQAAAAVNCWLDQHQPRPLPTLQAVAGVAAFSASARTIYRFSETDWFQWPDEVSVARAPVIDDNTRRTIWMGDGFPKFTSTVVMQGGGFVSPGLPISRRLGIPVPDQLPQTMAGALTDEDADANPQFDAWVYTFLSDLGEEGAPSNPSGNVRRGFNVDGTIQPVTITMPTGVTGPYNITHKRIYRTSTGTTGDTTYNLLTQIPLSQADFIDTALDSSLGSALITTDWDPPAEDLQGVIALPNGVLAAFREREVHFSEPYQAHAWPGDNIQVVDADIVGLDNFGTTVVVGTKGDPHLINGSDPSLMTPQKMELNQACQARTSFAYIDLQGVVYASPDGLVLVGPAGGRLLSRPIFDRSHWQAFGPTALRSVYHDGAYLGFLADRAIAVDFEQEGVIETTDIVRAVFHDRERDRLYVVDSADNMLKEWVSDASASDARRMARWRSHVEVDMRRTFQAAQVVATGYPMTFRLLVDDVAVFESQIFSRAPFRLPYNIGMHGEWQYETEGQHTVEEVRVGAMGEMIWYDDAAAPSDAVPGTPARPVLVTRTQNEITVRTVPGSGGTPSRYRWRLSTDDVVDDADFTATTTPASVRFTLLDAGTNYWIDVRAENGAGVSAYSEILQSETLAVMPPGVPATPTLVGRTHNSITVETNMGVGGAPTRYRWRFSLNDTIDGADPTVASNGTRVTITGLSPLTDYWIDVRAENDDGESSYSGDLATATLQAQVTTRYLLLTANAAVPSAQNFLDDGVPFNTDTVAVPSHLQERYYHVAELRNDISNIHEEDNDENFRDQWTAMADLPTRDINGTTYYIYSTIFAQFPVGFAIPVVFEGS